MKKASLYLQSFFYIFAGLNHFINPVFYFPLIPDYLQQWNGLINGASGVIEIALGILLIFSFARQYAAFCIVIMLIAFIPSHVYFIQLGNCIPDGLCVPAWIGWGRLLIIHPLLMWWAWSLRKH